jgi:hypothetical protein
MARSCTNTPIQIPHGWSRGISLTIWGNWGCTAHNPIGPDTDKFNAAASAIQDLTGKATVTPADLSRLQTLGLRFNCSHCMRTIDDPIAAASRNSGSVCVHSSGVPFNS